MSHIARIETAAGRRRLARRIFAHRCTRYGVSTFDWPTFCVIYPLHARAIANLLGVSTANRGVWVARALRPSYETQQTFVEVTSE